MRKTIAAVTTAGLALALAACGGGESAAPAPATSDSAPASAPAAKTLEGVTVEVAAKWTGAEQTNFEQVLKAFEAKTGAKVTYASTGEDTGAYLGPRIEAATRRTSRSCPSPAWSSSTPTRRRSSRSPPRSRSRSTTTTPRTGRSSAPPTARPTACW